MPETVEQWLSVSDPSARDLRERLMVQLRKPGCAYPAGRLYDLLQPVSERVLNGLLHGAIECGAMDSYVVVESPYGGGIAEYSTVHDVPEYVTDWQHDGERLRVEAEHIRVYFRLAAA
jgi:hypothetical protein